MNQDSKPTYKHISELIKQYLKQYRDLYGNEIYVSEPHNKNIKQSKD